MVICGSVKAFRKRVWGLVEIALIMLSFLFRKDSSGEMST